MDSSKLSVADQVSLGLWWSMVLRGRSVDTASWGLPLVWECLKGSPSKSSRCSSVLQFSVRYRLQISSQHCQPN